MQMEPWRKRGFVPDSDEEDEFDSLETKEEAIDYKSDQDLDLEYLPVPVSATVTDHDGPSENHIEGAADLSTTDLDNEEERQGSVELLTSPVAKRSYMKQSNSPSEGSAKKSKYCQKTGSRSTSSDEQTPKPRRGTKTYGKRSSVKNPTDSSENSPANPLPPRPDDAIWNVPSSPPAPDVSAKKPRRRGRPSKTKASTPTKNPQSSTFLRPKNRDSHLLANAERSRSSSPDELNVVEQPITEPRRENAAEKKEIPPPEGSEDDSPLSSPPLSIHSPDDETQPIDDIITADAQQTALEKAPEVQIPQELLDEIHAVQPARRTFRERNAIQMHPYMLEMAKYERLMKEGGIRPVRAAIEAQRRRAQEATDESQEQDEFNPENLRSSPPPEEYLPPARPERRREEDKEGNGNENRRHEESSVRRAHSTKRRRKSHSGAWHDVTGGGRVMSQVVIDNQTPRNSRLKAAFLDAIPDLPSSPPDSGGVSSATATPRASEGFRFPPGFIPPLTTTTALNSKSATPPEDEPNIEGLDSADGSEDGEASNSSQSSSAAPGETAEEREIRRIQRQTRGVLPASWVRLEARQRLEQQKAAQLNRNAATQRTDGKGVARKIARKSGQNARTVSLIDLGDIDSSDNETQSVNDQPARHDVEIRHETSFDDIGGGDIMEDNRIDYMLPTISRKSSNSLQKRKSLKRPKSKETIDQSERRAKKARLKRQTRLTDDSYGTRRTKTSSVRRVPRLGILDAPDVASKPREEQPRFLRVVSRTARSRRDAGRRSPTRKFFQFSSKKDTVDANQSLREWTGGKIRQCKTVRPQSKPRKRQPLKSLSNGSRQPAEAPRRTHNSNQPLPVAPTQPDVVMLDDEDHEDHYEQENNSTRETTAPAAIPQPEAAAAPTQMQKQGHQWVVRRNMPISSLHRNVARPAVTSLAEPGGSQTASKSAFSRKLTVLNRDYRQQHKSRAFKPSVTLDRFISNHGSFNHSSSSLAESSTVAPPSASHQHSTVQNQQRRRLKKSTPRQIVIDTDEFLGDTTQDVATPNADGSNYTSVSYATSSRTPTFNVGGLFNWQPSYALEFGITPLREGIFFHESTFIGRGEFSRSLQLTQRNLDHGSRSSSIMVKDECYQWGSWNDIVSSQMGFVFDIMATELDQYISQGIGSTQSTSSFYRSSINYVTDGLSFIDPIDRKEFVHRTMGLISRLREPVAAHIVTGKDEPNGLVMFACYNLVFANQIRQIAEHQLVGPDLAKDAFDFVKVAAKDVITLASSKTGVAGIHRFLEDIKKPELRVSGIHDEFPSVTAMVVAGQVLRSSECFNGVLAEIQLEVCTKGLLRQHKDVRSLESAWHNMFTFLPLNEIDHHGIARRDLRFKAAQDNWNLVKRLLSPALDNVDTNSVTQPISYNSYCRTLFQRCHRLINVWGWRECKPILDNLYDFFALKLLYNLKLEESRGSPSFLDELDGTPSLEIRAGEPCFHTFLKIIASGLRFLASRYDKKKMRNFAWRLLPNNGRVYPKENPLRHEDLDAVRNHHDLLCTLYWAVPDGCRPRLEAIRNLVHPATSHQETCSINIRAWIRLIRFKLSTDEEVASLEPFADWHSYFMTELQLQHSQARSEIETQSRGDKSVSKELVESLISQNQRQIESLLNIGLSGLRTAVELAPSLEHAHKLISKTPFDAITGLFNPKISRINTVVSEALQVVIAYVNQDCAPPKVAPNPAAAASIDDDSQEFEGLDDWNDIDAVLVQQDTPKEEIEYVQGVLSPIVSRLLSNCFGADNAPEDAILMNVVDSWTSIAYSLVRHGLQRWDNYLSQFGDKSWAQLRQTLQTRKYAAQFLALCIEKDSQILIESRNLVMGIWMSSLVERSSMLKFQHRLTEVILNGRPHDSILENLPFVKERIDDKYHISLQELSQRRVSLLSCILSNMREHVLQLEVSGSRDLSVTKQEYSELLQQLMTAMQNNYRELGNGDLESAQGSYVDFVHRIIRFLQELTSDIRPVDPFFTNPALFPLPSTDPRYIVAKLKRYEPKLASNKEVQTLMMFVQSIVERATVELQQNHLVDQLHTAMKGTFEAGQHNRPTLRAVLMQCVFPAYIELTFSTPAAWLLSRPIMQSVSLVFKDLLFSIDTKSPACVSSLLRIFDAVFQSSYNALRPLSIYASRFKEPVVLFMFSEFLKMISSSLVVIDYLDRVTDEAESLISYIEWFRDLSTAVSSELNNSSGARSDMNIPVIPAPEQSSDKFEAGVPRHLLTCRRAAYEDHQSYLKNWSFHENKYYHTRSGHDSKELSSGPEILAIIQSEAEAKKMFDDAMNEFSSFMEQLELFPV